MDPDRRDEILRTQATDQWQRAEPHIGGYYGEEEIQTVVEIIRDSMDPNEGFGFICEEITRFEEEFVPAPQVCLTAEGHDPWHGGVL